VAGRTPTLQTSLPEKKASLTWRLNYSRRERKIYTFKENWLEVVSALLLLVTNRVLPLRPLMHP